MKPKIQFKVDKEYIKEDALYYLDKESFVKFVRDFKKLLDARGMSKEEAKNLLNVEIDEIYSKENLDVLIPEIKKKWDTIKDTFFTEVEMLFNHRWPKGTYEAYLSVFGMYRWKWGTKQFSIPTYDYAGNPPAFGHINFVICHELLHIFIEDYYKKNFNGVLDKKKYNDFLELMNCVVLNLPEINKITGWVNYPYEEHKTAYGTLKGVYSKSKDMKEFCEQVVDYLEKN